VTPPDQRKNWGKETQMFDEDQSNDTSNEGRRQSLDMH
jgi:hypothetical protein